MKKTIMLLLGLAILALAVVCVVQSRKSATQQIQIATLRGERDAQSQQIDDLQDAQKQTERQRRELAAQADTLAAQLRARQLARTNPAAAVPTTPPATPEIPKPDQKDGFGKMLSKMMQDPDTRKFIREQQRVMMDQLYAPLVKQMNLTPDEAAQFKDLLADNMMKSAEKASSMFGDAASTNRSELFSALAADQKSFEEQLKAFLGEARYAQYQAYQETAAERMQLNAFKQQLGGDYNLSDPQTEALLGFMAEERRSVAATTGLPLGAGDRDPAQLQALLSGDKINQLLQAQETVSQRVYERARTILSPDQLQTFGSFQTNQLRMMRMGMSMARNLFAPDSANPSSPSPNP